MVSIDTSPRQQDRAGQEWSVNGPGKSKTSTLERYNVTVTIYELAC